MTSETIQMERYYPAGHRDRHAARLCPRCACPLTADGRCTRCAHPGAHERLSCIKAGTGRFVTPDGLPVAARAEGGTQ